MRPIIPPPIIGLAIAFCMWLAARSASGLSFDLPHQLFLAGILIAAGLLIEAISVAAFWRRKTTVNPLAPSKSSALVTEGLYRISRNPMYLGMALLLIGWGVYLGNPINLLLIGSFVWIINVAQIKPEERALREIFGAEYDAYARRVRRWI